MRKVVMWGGLLLGAATVAVPAMAEYPDRTVRLVVPFAPGGPTDLVARQLAAQMAPNLGQAVVVENRTGAGGTVGTDVVARADADGYTLLFATFSHVINATLQSSLPYDSVADFAPISMIANSYLALTAPLQTPGSTVAEFVAAVRADPDSFNYGSAGVGSGMHLAAAMFNAQSDLNDVMHVPYRGNSQTLPALMSGEVAYAFMGMDTIVPQVRDGRLKALAVTSPERDPLLPDVPTLAESGYDEFDVGIYMMVMAPAGTPDAVVARLNESIRAAMDTPEFVATVDGMAGMRRMTGYDPQATAEFVFGEIDRWRPIIEASGAANP